VARLGILGGTFDPIHHGHLLAAVEVHHQLGLDRVLFLPAGNPPHKPGWPITPIHHRLRMVELAIAGRPHLTISQVDAARPGPSYSVDTLELLRTEWGPDPDFFFIMGADSLANILTWYQPQRLLKLCQWVVVGRPRVEIDMPTLEEQLPGLADRVRWVQMPFLEISSSDLRVRLREGRPISYLVPAAVEAYIREQGLYDPG
jgi:nicotinate-nucleotide adenylyltransferase